MAYILNHFLKPTYLLLLMLLPLMILWYRRKYKLFHGEILYSGFAGIAKQKQSYKFYLIHIQYFLRILSVIFVILALARPISIQNNNNINIEGIDIILVMDISGSMQAEDFKPNRIEASKKVASDFIYKRPSDRIGLIGYSSSAFTSCPLTIDHTTLQKSLSNLKNNLVSDGTAIGDGLSLAIERLRLSDAKSKIIVLLTDGINNMGFIDPIMASEMAKEYGIRIYAIGVGEKGKAPYPIKTYKEIKYKYFDVEIDEPLLSSIAKGSGGKYFRAIDSKSLQIIYNEIDTLERSKIKKITFTKIDEHFVFLIILAAACFLIELLLKYKFLKMLP